MLSNLGTFSSLIALAISFALIIFSYFEIKISDNKVPKRIYLLSFYQLAFSVLSFLILLVGYIFSDFSMINVYENSHTTKPLFYKISGVWGNHEGSLLLWINILVLFSFLFLFLNNNKNKKFRILTLIIQNLLISIFFIFLLTNSNPFSKIFPIPNEGMGLNPILQDPILAIHPPLLYLGFVGSSIYFSAALAALLSQVEARSFAISIKPWVSISWFFQTVGILAGSIWAYYELGWGGFWFWDPVENSSLMPWFLMTALLHSVLVLERRIGLYSWVIILSILTFTMSVVGTFLVRSGILNSVHTFANDPSRGLFILTFLILMVFSSIFIFFKYAPVEKKNYKIFTKEFFILINNWFMIFFLTVVLIGTLYPVFLDTLFGTKISVGPPYYNFILAPFLIPLLFLMTSGPKHKWITPEVKKIFNFALFISFVLFLIIFLFIKNESNFLLNIILLFSLYLIAQTILDLYQDLKNGNFNLSRFASHFGFGLLIFFISINYIFSIENNFNVKVGEKKIVKDYVIKFKNLETLSKNNYQSVIGYFEIQNKNQLVLENLTPEIRIYNKPEIITYEASIKSKFFSDTYLTMSNISNTDIFNIKFQKKPFMNFIWLSVLLISVGGVLNFFSRKKI
ncbi:MAG: cytochrome C biogenesis protein [Candidatus Pelagibacter sp.]|nr:cytochrome C biogenesis protein [Candidatus Pelagibacter sp.]|tara:strand:- start:341 stop:2218 length:1878 start_codon:yes stop_codon:yes gene_type:complete